MDNAILEGRPNSASFKLCTLAMSVFHPKRTLAWCRNLMLNYEIPFVSSRFVLPRHFSALCAIRVHRVGRYPHLTSEENRARLPPAFSPVLFFHTPVEGNLVGESGIAPNVRLPPKTDTRTADSTKAAYKLQVTRVCYPSVTPKGL